MIIGRFSSLEVHYHAPWTRAASGGIFSLSESPSDITLALADVNVLIIC